MTITNGYATLAQVRAEIAPYQASDTTDDPLIELSVEAASRQIDQVLGYRLWQDADVVAREFYADGSCCDLYEQPWMTPKAGISTLTGLIVKTDTEYDGTFATTLTINTDFTVWPPNAGDETETCFTQLLALDASFPASFPSPSNGLPGVQITARFGWSAVPDWATKACIVQATQLFKAKDTPFGVASFGDVGGGLRVREALNPIAAALVKPHARVSIG